MAINSVDMERALNSASYAQQVLRSGNVSAEQKGQLIGKWGAENVNKWLSVDSTKYEIDDASYDSAKQAGVDFAKDSTGHDGSTHSTASTIGSAAMGAAGAAASVGTAAGVGFLNKTGNSFIGRAGQTEAEGVMKNGNESLGMYAAAILAIATAAKYWIENPNKEQVDAAEVLMNSELPQAQESLSEAQANMQDATEEVTALAEEAEEANNEANDKIEQDKTLFDFYREQFEALKAKKESGEALTPDEKELYKSLAPMLEDLSEGIDNTSEETSGKVNDLNGEMGDYQEVYDESAETIANVEGVTDFAEGFDETTRTLCYVEGATQTINSASGAWAGAKLLAGGFWNWALGLASIAAGISSGIAAGQQMHRASIMTEEIHTRRDTQELGTQTNDVYAEELDNFAGNIETVEDLELDIPDDMEVPESTTVPEGDDTANQNPFLETQNKDDQKGNNSSLLTLGQGEDDKNKDKAK